jgi:hypothetical protein
LIRRTQRVPAFIKTDVARVVAKSVQRYAGAAPAAGELYNRIDSAEANEAPPAKKAVE